MATIEPFDLLGDDTEDPPAQADFLGAFGDGRRGGYRNGDAGEGERDRTHSPLERRSGTSRGTEIKLEGSVRGNWGMRTDELAQVTEEVVNEDEKNLNLEKPSGEDDAAENVGKEATKEENEEKPEDKEMTLEEYKKLFEEKRKNLLAYKSKKRKVDAKEFESVQALSNKKANGDIFIKLGSEKDKNKEFTEKEERAKKTVSINEFLKPAEGEKYHSPGGGRRGHARGGRVGGYGGLLEKYEKLLEQAEKFLEEKGNLLGLKSEQRKVDAKEFVSKQALSNKKDNDDIFIKLRKKRC